MSFGYIMNVLTNGWDLLLTLLYNMTEESFWLELLGDRIVALLKRWIGNDVFFYGMLFYIAPIVTRPFNRLLCNIDILYNSYWYCTIRVKEGEYDAYNALQWYVASQLGEKSFRHVEAKMVHIPQHQNHHENSIVQPRVSKLELFPTGKNQEFYYKVHKIWINIRKENPDGFENVENYGGQLSDVLNMVNKVNSMSITMKTRQINLLHSYLEEWIELHHKMKYGKMTIYKSSITRYYESCWIQVGTKASRSFDSVILKSGQKEMLLNDIQLFRQREKWYAQLGLPYRRGYLLRGPFGTGKTSLVQSIASYLNMNLAILSISAQMVDEGIQYLLQTMPYNSILLIEDIDHCTGFKKTHNTSTSDSDSTGTKHIRQLSMTGILNALDGVTAQEGSMIFMSCNNMDDIEPALLRPGRIDIKLDLGYCDRGQIKAMYHRFINQTTITCSPCDDHNVVSSKPPLTAAQSDDDMESPTIKRSDSSLSLGSTTTTSSTTIEHLGVAATTLPPLDNADRFADAIPCDYVTPPELQNFFISHLDIIQASTSPIECILGMIPRFLETVNADRNHATSHHGEPRQQTTGTTNKNQQHSNDRQGEVDDDTKCELDSLN